jgi:phage/plasmid-associated DNA primase
MLREPYQYYITRCIDYDYVPFPSQEAWHTAMVDIEKFLLQIIREPDVLNSIAFTIAKSLVNGNVKACDLLYLYGGCGKSTIFQLLRKTLTDVYVYEIASDAFDTSGEAQRAINGITSTHRILVWNEPDPTKKKKSSFIKQLCDGVVTVKKLYHDGNFKKVVHAKLFITANNLVEFDTQDTGVTRRLNYYNFKIALLILWWKHQFQPNLFLSELILDQMIPS